MEQTHGTVGGGGGAEILQVGSVFVVQLRAQPLLHAGDEGNLLHDLHADGGAQKLCLRLFGGGNLNDPGGLPPFVGEQAKVRNKARNGAHDVHDTGVAVAPGTQHGVGVHHGGGFCPAENVSHLGCVAHLIHIAGAGEGVLVHQTQLLQLLFIGLLPGVHEIVEHKVLQKIGGDIFIQRPGIHGEFLLGDGSAVDELLHQVKDWPHHFQAEGGDQMVVLGGNRHQLVGVEGVAVHHQGFHHLGHSLAFGAVQNGLLFVG